MEALVTIIAVGAYAERQYQKQDGSSEYFKSRGVRSEGILEASHVAGQEWRRTP